jgi:hypothetical protein
MDLFLINHKLQWLANNFLKTKTTAYQIQKKIGTFSRNRLPSSLGRHHGAGDELALGGGGGSANHPAAAPPHLDPPPWDAPGRGGRASAVLGPCRWGWTGCRATGRHGRPLPAREAAGAQV